MNKLRRVFNPTADEQREDYNRIKEIHEEQKLNRGCTTCLHCHHVISYPGVTTAEECECGAGLNCDTVLGSVKNCPTWKEKRFPSFEKFAKIE